jgi:hypothetical protein
LGFGILPAGFLAGCACGLRIVAFQIFTHHWFPKQDSFIRLKKSEAVYFHS